MAGLIADGSVVSTYTFEGKERVLYFGDSGTSASSYSALIVIFGCGYVLLAKEVEVFVRPQPHSLSVSHELGTGVSKISGACQWRSHWLCRDRFETHNCSPPKTVYTYASDVTCSLRATQVVYEVVSKAQPADPPHVPQHDQLGRILL